jgi:hypothetical protein
MAHPLEVPRRKLSRAKEHVADLDSKVTEFFERPDIYEFVVDPDPQEPKHVIHKMRFKEPLPESFTAITADAVNNLRSALDAACYAIAVAAGATKPRHAAFPFAGSFADFENGMKGRCKDIPLDLHALFRAYQPYKGGNDALWALNDICVRDKHTLLGIGLDTVLGDLVATGTMRSIPVNPPWDSVSSPCLNPDFSRNEEPAEFSPPQGRYNTLQEGV